MTAAATIDPRTRRLWIAIIVAGFVLRAAWALLVSMHPVSDGSAYDELAWNLATKNAYAWNNGILTAVWPVGTSFIYSLVFRIFGHDYAAASALNVLVGTATIPLVMALARRWVSDTAALIVGAMFAFWPMQIEFTSIMASELFFNLLVLVALWLALEAQFQSMAVRALVVGVVLAAASLIRVHATLFPFLFALALVWRHRTRLRDLVLFAGISFVAMAACIAPWTIRNTHVFGEVVPISDNSGAVFWAGNNDLSTGECCAPLPADVAKLPELQIDHVLRERTKIWVRENPGRAAWLFWRKLYLTHNRETMGIVWNQQSLSNHLSPSGILAAKAVSTLYWFGAFFFGIAGALLVLTRERWRGLIHPAIMLWAYFAFVHAVAQASDRYHLPSTPYIAILAGFALVEAWQRWQSRRPVEAMTYRPAEQES